MNRTNKFLALGFALVSLLFINSCVEDDDFTTPDLTVNPVNVAALGQFTSFSNIVSAYDAAILNGDSVGVFSADPTRATDLYTVGYVVSDDGQGNFFEEIIIQNTPGNIDPTGDVRRGLKVQINTRDLGGFYNFGRKVYIKLNGLAIGFSNGVYTLGKANGNSLAQLEEAEYKNFVLRDPETVVITPKTVAIENLTDLDENTLIQLENSQIAKYQRFLTFAGEASDSFDGDRKIVACNSNTSLRLQTSTFSDFKSAQLPQGKGTVTGVYTRDFGDDYSVIVVNSIADIKFTDPNVCDPDVLECIGVNGGSTVLYQENFTNFNGFAAENWTTTNVNGTSLSWRTTTFSGNTYSQITAFRTGVDDAEVWLVTPDVDLSATTEEQLTFDVEAAYYTREILEVFVSEDFTGDVTTATWVQLDARTPSGFSGTFSGFQPAGPLNISCLNGSVNFAFVYHGSDPAETTRYHLDNIKVTGN